MCHNQDFCTDNECKCHLSIKYANLKGLTDAEILLLMNILEEEEEEEEDNE